MKHVLTLPEGTSASIIPIRSVSVWDLITNVPETRSAEYHLTNSPLIVNAQVDISGVKAGTVNGLVKTRMSAPSELMLAQRMNIVPIFQELTIAAFMKALVLTASTSVTRWPSADLRTQNAAMIATVLTGTPVTEILKLVSPDMI